MRWLVLASVLLLGCAGSRDYKAHQAYLVENSTLVYVDVGKIETEMVSCESKECLLFDTNQRYTDSRLVAVDTSTGAQSDIAGKSVGQYSTQGRHASGHVVPTPSPWQAVGRTLGASVVSPQGYVAYFAVGDEPHPAIVVGPHGVQPVDVGVVPWGTKVAASELGFTLVAGEPLRAAQVRWEGPVATALQPLGIEPADGAQWKLTGLSARGRYVLVEVFDAEQRDESGKFLGWGSNGQKWRVVALPDGEIAASYDFSSRNCRAITWLSDTELVATFGQHPDVQTVILRVEGGEFVLDTPFPVSSAHFPPGADVYVSGSMVVTPEGRMSVIEADRGHVFEGRRAWAMAADGEIRVWDLDRSTSRSLGRLKGNTRLLGKNAAGLIALEIGEPSRLWVLNPEDGARRDVVLTTTTAEGVEEVGGER